MDGWCDKFPEELLERSNLRWERLFFGVWNALDKHDRNITFGLLQSLKEFGLADDNFFYPQVFEENPSHEVLRRVTAFNSLAHIPTLKGKKLPEKRYDPFFALHDYSVALFGLKEFPRRFVNSAHPINFIKERLQEMESRMILMYRKEIPKHLLSKWIGCPKRELVVRLVAYLHGFSVASFRKYLKEAKQKHPRAAAEWKHGLDYTNYKLHDPERLEMGKREMEKMMQESKKQQ